MRNKIQSNQDKLQKGTPDSSNQKSNSNPFDWNLNKIDIPKISFKDLPKTEYKVLNTPYLYANTLQNLRFLLILIGHEI